MQAATQLTFCSVFRDLQDLCTSGRIVPLAGTVFANREPLLSGRHVLRGDQRPERAPARGGVRGAARGGGRASEAAGPKGCLRAGLEVRRKGIVREKSLLQRFHRSLLLGNIWQTFAALLTNLTHRFVGRPPAPGPFCVYKNLNSSNFSKRLEHSANSSILAQFENID